MDRVLTILEMTATSHHELSTDLVEAMRIVVDRLLSTTVYPTCTAEEVETLWGHHSNLNVRRSVWNKRHYLLL